MEVLAGSTDITTYFKLRLAADGTAATGLTITDLDLQYVRSGVAPAAKVDATALAATDSAHADNKAIEIDATDQPGLYRVDWPDAAFAAGVREVILTVKHTTIFTEDLRVNLTPVPSNVEKWNNTDVPSEHAAGYPIVTIKDGTGTGEINTNGGAIVLVETVTTLTGHTPQTGDSYAIVNSGTHGNAALKSLIDAVDNFVDTEITSIITTLGVAGAGLTDLGGFSTTAKGQIQTEAEDALANYGVARRIATGTAQSGTSSTIVLAASTAFASNILNGSAVAIISGTGAGQVRVIRDYDGSTDECSISPNWNTNPSSDSVYEIVPASVNIVTAPISASAGVALQASALGYLYSTVAEMLTNVLTADAIATNAIGASELAADAASEIATAVATALGTGTAFTAIPWNASWDAEVQSEVIDALQETVPDSVPADGSRPNIQQAVRMILNTLIEGGISGTTWTIKKEDGSTTLFTVTLDSSSTPTSKTRSG